MVMGKRGYKCPKCKSKDTMDMGESCHCWNCGNEWRLRSHKLCQQGLGEEK